MEANPYAAPLASETAVRELDPSAPPAVVAKAALLDALLQAVSIEMLVVVASVAVYEGPDTETGNRDALLALASMLGLSTHALLLAASGRSIGGWLTKTRLVAARLQFLSRSFAALLLTAWALGVSFASMICGAVVFELMPNSDSQTELKAIIAACVGPWLLLPVSWAFARSRWHAPLLGKFGMRVVMVRPPADHSGRLPAFTSLRT